MGHRRLDCSNSLPGAWVLLCLVYYPRETQVAPACRLQRFVQQSLNLQESLRTPSVRERIAQVERGFTESERRIADYLLARYRELTYANASQLARALDLSASTLVRFAQKLGFDGYPSLQRRLQDEFFEQQSLVAAAPSASDFVASFVDSQVHNLKSLVGQSAALSEAGSLLCSADTLWVAGDRSSAFVATLGQHYLRMIRPAVRTLGFLPGEWPDQLLDVGSSDAVLLVSVSRYSQRSFALARHLSGRTPLVLLTDALPSPVLPYADVSLRVSTDDISGLRSDVSAVAMLQALILTVAQRTPAAADRIAQAESLWDDFRVFHKEEL